MARAKPYKAKTLRGAEARVRMLQRTLIQYDQIVERQKYELRVMRFERNELAKLAAKGPAYWSPLSAWAAEQLRDRILRDECGLAPDGSPLPREGSQ